MDTEQNTFVLTHIKAKSDGTGVTLQVECTHDGQNEIMLYPLDTESYLSINPQKGILNSAQLTVIKNASAFLVAWESALRMLAYARNSAKALELKLREKGTDKDTAGRVVAKLVQKGYLDESSDAQKNVCLCIQKGWGPKRILSWLYEKKVQSSVIADIKEQLETGTFRMENGTVVDFAEVCYRQLLKMKKPMPKDYAERQKMVAVLVRKGFLPGQIKSAMERFAGENNE